LRYAIIVVCFTTAGPVTFLQQHLDFSDEEVLSFVDALQNNRASIDMTKPTAAARFTYLWYVLASVRIQPYCL